MHDNSNASRIRATAFAAAFGAAMPLYAADSLPPEHTHGAIVYRSGGIGEGEAAAMQAAAGRYTLTAWHNGKAQTRAVTIGPQHVRVVFECRASHEQ